MARKSDYRNVLLIAVCILVVALLLTVILPSQEQKLPRPKLTGKAVTSTPTTATSNGISITGTVAEWKSGDAYTNCNNGICITGAVSGTQPQPGPAPIPEDGTVKASNLNQCISSLCINADVITGSSRQTQCVSGLCIDTSRQTCSQPFPTTQCVSALCLDATTSVQQCPESQWLDSATGQCVERCPAQPQQTAAPTCSDGFKNGNETDVDCGGSCPNKCAYNSTCIVNADCTSNFCNTNTSTCAAPTCADGFRNGNETDIDCGGTCTTKCGIDKICSSNNDCSTNFCNPLLLQCKTASCTDTFKNGLETDVDCGGTCTTKCPVGSNCTTNSDCANGFCKIRVMSNGDITKKCELASCADGFKNGNETGVDCGGSCSTKCADNITCNVNADCQNNFCNPTNKICLTPTCSDNFRNGNETGVDCGGSCLAQNKTCPAGTNCTQNIECTSGLCSSGQCTTAQCNDGIKNGNETDIDCGGSCTGCIGGKNCTANSDCASNNCNATTGKCFTPAFCTDSDACILSGSPPPPCFNPFLVKGATQDNTGNYTDVCNNYYDLTEFYCTTNATGSPIAASNSTTCQQGCNGNGACFNCATTVDSPESSASYPNYCNQNYIFIGSPCNNAAIANMLGTTANCQQGLNAGQGFIKMFKANGFLQILVMGIDQQGLDLAVAAFKDIENYTSRAGRELSVLMACTASIPPSCSIVAEQPSSQVFPTNPVQCQGAAATTSTTGGGGGGGGIGRGAVYRQRARQRQNITITTTAQPSCTAQWSCTDWSDCNEQGVHYRTCTPTVQCPENYTIPVESEQCLYIPPTPTVTTTVTPNVTAPAAEELPQPTYYEEITEEKGMPWWVYALIALGIVTAGSGGALYAMAAKRGRLSGEAVTWAYTALRAGRTPDMVKQALSAKGWVESDIAQIMPRAQLRIFVENLKKQGIPEAEIAKRLVQTGWKGHIAKEIVKKHSKTPRS